MNFCPHCGQAVALLVPAGDHLPRHVCQTCGAIHYQNPRIIAGCIPEYDGRLLLCRRAIQPRLGFWTIPAGFLENGETIQQGAAREALEEACARVEIGSLLSIVHVLHVHQVHMVFRAQLLNDDFGIAPESLEVKLLTAEDIPWDELAFESVRFSLRQHLEERRSGRHSLHFHTID